MTGRIFHKVALLLVFAAGIGSIMATSRIYEYDFEDTNIQPAWRCAGADVAVSWSLGKPVPVTILVNDAEWRRIDGDGRLTLPAELFDRGELATDVTLRIEAEDAGYSPTYSVVTANQPAEVEKFMFGHLKQGSIFDFNIKPDDQVDRRMLVTGLTLNPPWDEGSRLKGLHWVLLRDPGPDPALTPENGYSVTFAEPVPALGTWRFRLTHLPEAYVHDPAARGEGCNTCELATVDVRIQCPR